MTDYYQTAGDIRRALVGIADHYDVALHPPKRGGGNGGKASKEPPPPVSVDVIDARADTHKDLVHYAQVVLMECRSAEDGQIVTRVDGASVRGLIKFLDVWAEHLARGNVLEAEACARDLTAHADKLRGMALPDRRDWMPLGTCPLVTEEEAMCGGQVRRYDGRLPQCQKCGTEGDAAWWEEVTTGVVREKVMRDELPELIYRAFGRQVSRPTLHRWIKSGELVRVDDEREGEWFNRAKVIDAVAARWEPDDKLA